MAKHMKLSVIIPARNEAGIIQTTVVALRNYLDSVQICNFELLVVDDGSSDATYDLVQSEHLNDERICAVHNSGNHGFGRAVVYGLDHFSGDAVIIYMADASDAPEDVARYYQILRDEADCVFGSRFIAGSKVYHYPRFKLVINRIANFVIKVMFRLKFNDVTNAFKGYRANVIQGCRPLISPHFNLTVELPLKAIVRGYTFRVIPISWSNREVGMSSLKLREQGSRYLYSLLTVWFEWLLTQRDYRRPESEIFEPWSITPGESKIDELQARPGSNL